MNSELKNELLKRFENLLDSGVIGVSIDPNVIKDLDNLGITKDYIMDSAFKALISEYYNSFINNQSII